jgi:hypothetical protein
MKTELVRYRSRWNIILKMTWAQDGNVVSIATLYGLDGPRFEPRLRRDILFFPYSSRLTVGPNQPFLEWVVLDGEAAGTYHPPKSST